MGARTLLYRLLIISPVALITWIVGTGRVLSDNFEFVGCTEQQQKDIAAYRNVVVMTTPLKLRSYRRNPAQIRSIAAEWVKQHEAGKLKPLTPAFLGDSIQDGVKSEIRLCESSLYIQLRLLSEREIRAGNTDQALKDIYACLGVSQVLRGSDALAESACCQQQRSTLEDLTPMLRFLKPKQLEEARKRLMALRDHAPDMSKLIHQTSVFMIQNEPRLSPVDQWGTVLAQAQIKKAMQPSEIVNYIETRTIAKSDLPRPFAELYVGLRSRQMIDRCFTEVTDQISVLLNPKKGLS